MDIAVIGVSVKNSISEDMKEFHENLLVGASGSRCTAEMRSKMTNIPDHEKNMGNLRCMSGIEEFDYKFFGLSKREARRMSPEVRISMEYFVNAVYDAGYSLKDIKGSDMGVILSISSGEDYRSLFEQKDAFTYMGSTITSMAGAQLSYRFDLRGPAFIIDSSCCSSAVAVHEACMHLAAGECDVMVVGATETALFVKEGARQELDSVGIFTKKDYCCPLDEDVDGIIPGEGCGFVVLKPLEAALHDKDHIYAIIKGSAVNSNGSTSRDITSPSEVAECEVMKKAFSRAGVSADDITECELHSAGTLIGDAIEFDTLAAMYGKRKNDCLPVGTVKANIGHTGKVSGISALLKVISGFENDVFYPIANLKKINSGINLADGKIQPLMQPVYFKKGEKRIADIASYGINGTNVHIIAENYTEPERNSENNCRFLKISAASEKSFIMYRDSLCEYFRNFKGNIDDALYVLNCGRDDFRFRAVVEFKDIESFADDISCATPTAVPFAAEKKMFTPDCGKDIFSAWLSGYDVCWKDLYKDGDFHRVSAPAYKFSHDVLWAFDIN